MTSETQERLSQCFQTVFPDLPAAEIPKASMASLARWDSIAQVTLLVALEEEFALSFSPEDFEELTSFGLIAEFVESQAARG
jgi:acyl carrier protein